MITFERVVAAWCGLAVATFVLLLFVAAPYGRHQRAGWGPSIPARWGWLGMEAVSFAGTAAWFAYGGNFADPARWAFLVMWEAHYFQRSFVYPFAARMEGRTIPVSVVAMSVAFNTCNTALCGWDLYVSQRGYGAAWLADGRFLVGAALFVTGMAINLDADRRLRALRRDGSTAYAIPRGGLYTWISCPNYFGEILEWAGFAVATWSLGGLAFAVWTVANLAPRARKHHAWYRATFADYPAERRALVPFIM